MERFKACEKEMKTKAFSKDGLLMSEKLDPKEIERRELIEWVVQKIEDLNLQIEKVEAEAEKLRGTAKKGKKDSVKMTRATALEHTVERERWHVGRLELINRLLENCVVMTDKNAGFIDNVAQLQEDIQYYVDHNQEPDFMEDDEMYASLNLEEEEEMYVVGDIDHHDAHEADESRPTEPPTPDRDDHGHKTGSKDHDETLSPAKDKQPPNKRILE
ncbi:MAG: Not1 N-terminal domain, CCR4-Not complex component-domain-containing protein [Olpidium bornovanus]|uniref:Not1 N-terminal domain, CCR4-Not complex component-domain-containing protein n=1 Tax=Olpidium bornovanus TaxID=278681 RepID=A0A8H7ZQJ8_9FUNG|nr:MAG: Not1 N-terminal domain, CCR4-Not complex component-domain-containing protein [Olpidium bornovanus]